MMTLYYEKNKVLFGLNAQKEWTEPKVLLVHSFVTSPRWGVSALSYVLNLSIESQKNIPSDLKLLIKLEKLDPKLPL